MYRTTVLLLYLYGCEAYFLTVKKYNLHFFFNIAHTLHQVQHYLFIYQLLCTTLCFFTHVLVLAPTRFGVY
jgi:hypothetical protein